MNKQLAALLEADRDAVCDAWTQRLSDPALLAANLLQPGTTVPVRPLLAEVINLLRDPSAADYSEPGHDLCPPLEPSAGWRINLCQAVEVLLTGEVVVRYWAQTHLDLSETEALALFERINRVFHQLLRVYMLRYCEHCRAAQARPED